MPSVVYTKKTGEILRVTYNSKSLERKTIDRRTYEVAEFDGVIPENFKDYRVLNGLLKKKAKKELNKRLIVNLQRRVLELQKDFNEAKKQKLPELADQIADDITFVKKQLAKLGAK
jgi:hypothetical protein